MNESGFDAWLEFMPHAIEEWNETLPSELIQKLDGSFSSLLLLERWLVERFPNLEACESEHLLLDGAARYLGEYVRERCSGTWSFDEVPKISDIHPLKAVHDAIRYRTCHSFVGQLERTGTTVTPDEKYEGFLAWKGTNSFRIAEWKSEHSGVVLDDSLESLDALEGLLLERYESLSDAYQEFDQLDGAARYFGELLIRTFGGRWDMEVHHPESIFYGAPHLTGFERAGPPILAHQVIYNAIQRRNGDYISWIAGNLQS